MRSAACATGVIGVRSTSTVWRRRARSSRAATRRWTKPEAGSIAGLENAMRIDRRLLLSLGVAAIMSIAAFGSYADETCNSPYMSGLIKGQEDFVHVWTLGVPGMGDGSDKLVTIDANPASKTYGKVIHKISVGGHGEAHHMGFTDDRKYLWAGGLDDSKIYVFDVGTNPSHPTLVKTIDDF